MRKGDRHSEESILRMRAAQSGKTLSAEHRKHIGEVLHGLKKKPRSAEHRKHLSEALKGRILSEQWRRRIGLGSKGHIVSEETRNKISKINLGKKRSEASKQNMRGINSGQWKGGISHHCGYIQIMSPGHPFHNKKRRVQEHRLVVEKLIGRYLLPGESVHHINETRNDNRPENLMAFRSESAHQRFEKAGKSTPRDIIFDGRSLKH